MMLFTCLWSVKYQFVKTCQDTVTVQKECRRPDLTSLQSGFSTDWSIFTFLFSPTRFSFYKSHAQNTEKPVTVACV